MIAPTSAATHLFPSTCARSDWTQVLVPPQWAFDRCAGCAEACLPLQDIFPNTLSRFSHVSPPPPPLSLIVCGILRRGIQCITRSLRPNLTSSSGGSRSVPPPPPTSPPRCDYACLVWDPSGGGLLHRSRWPWSHHYPSSSVRLGRVADRTLARFCRLQSTMSDIKLFWM